ncbi:MAG: AraC family transcriptional regulator [Oscillospiraceae bacterium]|nr:AraC family transcriptional regulator [Oscillospiraceae bacterium]MDD4414176.1 AraC family transcriptional regulator [Oscillospiraceae bacterium]
MKNTIGREYNTGKIAQVECVANDTLKDLSIKDQCYLLLIISEGHATFNVGEKTITATAPCFICFDESEDPVLINKRKLKCQSIYFHPQFLNINMTFSLIKSKFYGDIAHTHDMFLLKPFIDKIFVVPITEQYLEILQNSFTEMKNELENQRDWYWSCRGRSYFMEIMIALERLYGLIGRGELLVCDDSSGTIKNERVKKAVLFIESHYSGEITLADIVKNAGLNHTNLTALFKEELNTTPMEYLWRYRVNVAKKHLAFTEVPLKDVSTRCGFKTVQHFSRIFKEHTDQTPAKFRKKAVNERKNEL